ncbi:NAD-dependent epimerase/dehydratase family protein [candidate division WWE3 bacterium]|nr:NAD-dependent epimerase/dehydratase family protein [candidate division WWE3 bacterium]MBT7350308.1 NAD-dependent epimerase/dehydratase family protein [candidate division WWE3 bacterium]
MAIKEQVIKKSALSPTVLIAGGAGFIGSHLANALLERDARVIVLDNFKTGKDVYVNNLVSNPKFAFFDANINEGIPKNIHSVDYIVHLAGVETYLYSRDTVSLDSLLTSAVGTKNLLELAQRSEAKFLLASSVDVYQGLLSPIDLKHYFGKTPEEEQKYSLSEAKRFAEALVWEFYKNHHTDVRITRLPEVYGPRMNLASSGNLGRLSKQLLENRDLDIFGEGTEREYYLYITDAVAGIVKALLNKGTEGKIFTLAPEEPHAILEIAYLLRSLADREVQVNFKKGIEATTTSTKIPDRGDLSALKWEPKMPFKQGVSKTLDWFGYETNEHSFKPNKLIEKKKEEKAKKNGTMISSLVDLSETPEIEEKEKTEKPKLVTDIKAQQDQELKLVKPKKTLTFPKLSFPKRKPKPQVQTPTLEKKKSFSPVNNVLASLAALVVALTVLVFLPFAQTVLSAKSGIEKLQEVPEILTSMNPQAAQDAANDGFQKLYKAQKAHKRTEVFFTMFGKQDAFESSGALLSSARHFARATYYSAKAADPFAKIWETIKPNSELAFEESSFLEAEVNLNEAKSSLQQALGDYKRVEVENLPEKVQTQAKEFGSILELAIDAVETGSSLAADIPNLLGSQNQLKRYLVLFQNSHEIRATGGFIGSYAVVEVQNGKIETLTIDDIYNPDGQIDVRDIQVSPVSPLDEILGEDRAYIRNANWNPDFPESVEDIKDLYFRVTGKEVDGIAAVDLFFAENILRVTGPVFLTAFGEEVSSENLYERAQLHSEFNYENGSNQKRAFLTIFGGKLLEGIFALSSEDMPKLMTEVTKALEERHLMISLSDSTFGAELEKKGWDGSLKDISASDYLYVVNSNVGGTKANYFVRNNMEYTVTSQTRDGLLRGVLSLKYNHTGTDLAWPGGPYKDYVRVLTQEGSNLTGAAVSYDGGQNKDIFEDIVITKEGKYNSFETLIELAPQQNATLTFYYDLPSDLSITQTNKDYNLYWQKQPGTKEDSIIFRFEPPFGMTANGHNLVSTETQLDTDRAFSLQLQ